MTEKAPESNTSDLLPSLRSGHKNTAGELFERVYTQLRKRARGQRNRWNGNPSLQTTALINEAYLKIVGTEDRSWENRSHFFAVASTAMRQILIDRARRKRAEKRGGDAPQLSLEELRERVGRNVAMTEEDAEAFIILDEALTRLEEEHARAARGIECRFFAGMTIKETAEALGVSTATVSRDWKQAKTWLYREMKRIRDGETTSASASVEQEAGE